MLSLNRHVHRHFSVPNVSELLQCTFTMWKPEARASVIERNSLGLPLDVLSEDEIASPLADGVEPFEAEEYASVAGGGALGALGRLALAAVSALA